MLNYELTHLYQPIVDMQDLRFIRQEALLRIDGIQNIEAFTQSLEASGEIIELDLHTLDFVLRQLEEPGRSSTTPVAINVSALSLCDPHFQEKSLEMLANSPAKLDVSVEITESSPIINVDSAKHFVRTLQALGCTVGMDDYGDGYACLELIDELQLDYLKISSALTQYVMESEESVDRINMALRYAQERDIGVIAEHIDNIPQYLALRDMGVQQGQGWLFAKADTMIEDPDLFRDALQARIENAIRTAP
jgi:EAL domain-containing protein (putative c-di-GMP-specific phosphodiesterase class I)